THIQFGDGESVALADVDGEIDDSETYAIIEGDYGTLEIYADGEYTYTPHSDPASIGQTDEFTYTISDGVNTDTATLTVTVDGDLVTDDTAQAGIEYEYLTSEGVNMPDAID